ncbi:MAG: DUF3850 domain-containing protein [Candidatus Electrothrix sp. AUS4]|nr:DUF3850 domain-containing protein [Candidatus Electrothrix sp. AUS4]
MKIHELKIHPVFFEDAKTLKKNFEVRKNDRSYSVGDVIFLREWHPDGYFTGRVTVGREIRYILSSSEFLQPGYVVLGLRSSGHLYKRKNPTTNPTNKKRT